MRTKTKAWNTDLSTVPSDEKLYHDYTTDRKDDTCSVKLKTLRINQWESFHHGRNFNGDFPNENNNVTVKWEDKPNQCTILKLFVKSKAKLTVSFYHSDGTVMAQGDWHLQWASDVYLDAINHLDNEHVGPETPRGTINTDHIADTQGEDNTSGTTNKTHDQTDVKVPDKPVPNLLKTPINVPHSTLGKFLNLSLTTPAIPGRSRTSIFSSQLDKLETKYISLCDEYERRLDNLELNWEDHVVQSEDLQDKYLIQTSHYMQLVRDIRQELDQQNEIQRKVYCSISDMEQRFQSELTYRDNIIKSLISQSPVPQQPANTATSLTCDKATQDTSTNELPLSTTSSENRKYYLVQGQDNILSNFSRCQLDIQVNQKKIRYISVEQSFHHRKALFLSRQDIADDIMNETEPKAIKRLGSKLDSHSEIHSWTVQERSEMINLLRIKAKQCGVFKQKLMHTGDALIYHSVVSRKWGIGMHTADICHPLDIDSITGENLFGILLMELRHELNQNMNSEEDQQQNQQMGQEQNRQNDQQQSQQTSHQQDKQMDQQQNQQMGQQTGQKQSQQMGQQIDQQNIHQESQQTGQQQSQQTGQQQSQQMGQQQSQLMDQQHNQQRDHQQRQQMDQQQTGQQQKLPPNQLADKRANSNLHNITGVNVLLIGSSNTKYIKTNKLFGSKRAKVIRASTAEDARITLSALAPSRTMEVVVVHVGLNDLRNDRPVGRVVEDIQTSMKEASDKFPNAYVAYSELFHVSNDNNTNQRVNKINDNIKQFCNSTNSSRAHIFIEHRELRHDDDLYEDSIHINRYGGIRSFVRDIHNAIRYMNTPGNINSGTGRSPKHPQKVLYHEPMSVMNAWNNGPPKFIPENNQHPSVNRQQQEQPRHPNQRGAYPVNHSTYSYAPGVTGMPQRPLVPWFTGSTATDVQNRQNQHIIHQDSAHVAPSPKTHPPGSVDTREQSIGSTDPRVRNIGISGVAIQHSGPQNMTVPGPRAEGVTSAQPVFSDVTQTPAMDDLMRLFLMKYLYK